MSQQINLNELDKSGDVRQIAEDAGVDRSTFLRNGALAGAGAVGLGIFGLPSIADATISTKKKSLKNDVKILNYALLLEYLEFSFYDAAVKQGTFASEPLKQFAAVVRAHEKAHVDFLKKGLGKSAIGVPTLNTDAVKTAISVENFAATAQALEDTGVSAYAGQGPNLKTKGFVVAALQIHSVEARHAAWIRTLLLPSDVNTAKTSALPAPVSFDKARTQGQVLKVVGSTKLVKSFDKSKI
ncbi:ferritin-like domain-containing protein [Patulibacter minatonensis]|uniref:ferritin-like domain-containing protein n=1 Tax=Patulibacter minatonensis TaxID=298163 RepID=UPI0004BB0A8A|nr:ferritin-like domain-containing protein [Patulibacter minatonensis]